ALDPGHELVAQADVGERAADHHLVVAAPAAVGVEVLALHAVRDQVLAGRGVRPDRPGGGDVAGGHRGAELGQHPRAGDVAHRLRLAGHAVEVRRLAHVRGLGVPGERVPGGRGQVPPPLVAGEHVGVPAGVHLAGDGPGDGVVDLLGRGPDVAQVDRLAV